MSDFGTFRVHVGRKDHKCEWCGETIPKGEFFAHYTGKWQEEWQNWRMHQDCYHAYQTDADVMVDGFMPFENERPGHAYVDA